MPVAAQRLKQVKTKVDGHGGSERRCPSLTGAGANLHVFEAFWGRANHFANDANMHSGPFTPVPNDLRLTVWEFNSHSFVISPGNL